MSLEVTYCEDLASAAEIALHLAACDHDYSPPLSSRVNLEAYAAKLATQSRRFEAWADGVLVGLVAVYFNSGEGGAAHISNVSVLKAWRGRKIGNTLLRQCLDEAARRRARGVTLEVAEVNLAAIRLYQRYGFAATGRNGTFIVMTANPIPSQ